MTGRTMYSVNYGFVFVIDSITSDSGYVYLIVKDDYNTLHIEEPDNLSEPKYE